MRILQGGSHQQGQVPARVEENEAQQKEQAQLNYNDERRRQFNQQDHL